jgi:hypothetical protein
MLHTYYEHIHYEIELGVKLFYNELYAKFWAVKKKILRTMFITWRNQKFEA